MDSESVAPGVARSSDREEALELLQRAISPCPFLDSESAELIFLSVSQCNDSSIVGCEQQGDCFFERVRARLIQLRTQGYSPSHISRCTDFIKESKEHIIYCIKKAVQKSHESISTSTPSPGLRPEKVESGTSDLDLLPGHLADLVDSIEQA
jgi:hypothetical protein